MAVYKDCFSWDVAAEAHYAAADVSEGQIVADFGCGPGEVAVELAKRVGTTGHVHAIDINADFLKITENNAKTAGVADRLTLLIQVSARTLLNSQPNKLDIYRLSGNDAAIDIPIGNSAFGFIETHIAFSCAYLWRTPQMHIIPTSIHSAKLII